MLARLYQGGAWSEVAKTHATAEAAGFKSRVLVASAGLGLRCIESVAPSYGATFTRHHSDSVGRSGDEIAAWWENLKQLPHALDPSVELRGRVLLVLSDTYASALSADLRRLAGRAEDSLLVGGVAIAGLPRIPADLGLRAELGGSAVSLNIRMARAWLSRLSGPNLYDDRSAASWIRWAKRVRREERFDRKQLSDEAVANIITNMTTDEPSISATRALRSLRNSGFACEQLRFKTLFHAVKAGSVK